MIGDDWQMEELEGSAGKEAWDYYMNHRGARIEERMKGHMYRILVGGLLIS